MPREIRARARECASRLPRNNVYQLYAGGELLQRELVGLQVGEVVRSSQLRELGAKDVFTTALATQHLIHFLNVLHISTHSVPSWRSK